MTLTIESKINKDIEKITRQGVINGIYVATNIVHKESIKNAPVYLSALRNSLSMEVDESKFIGQVYVPENSPAAKYAPSMEFGFKPHKPPVEALEGWVKSKWGASGKDIRRKAFILQAILGKKGYKPKNKNGYLRAALYDNADKVQKAFLKEVERKIK